LATLVSAFDFLNSDCLLTSTCQTSGEAAVYIFRRRQGFSLKLGGSVTFSGPKTRDTGDRDRFRYGRNEEYSALKAWGGL
jgi:hypothetical protein